MTEKDGIIVEDSLDATVEMGIALVETVVEDTPYLGTAWKLANALSRAGLKLRHKKALEFVEMIRDNPDIMTQKVLQTEAFQEGFAVAIEKYIRERSEEKRKIMQGVFLGFAKNDDMESFKLERLYTTVSLISVESIGYIAFIMDTILPRMKKYVIEQAHKVGAEYDREDWWTKYLSGSETLSKHINLWIDENYSPMKDKVKEQYNYDEKTDTGNVILNQIFEAQEVQMKKEQQALAEFVSLGICTLTVEGGGTIGGGGGHAEYLLTDFGWEVLSYFGDIGLD